MRRIPLASDQFPSVRTCETTGSILVASVQWQSNLRQLTEARLAMKEYDEGKAGNQDRDWFIVREGGGEKPAQRAWSDAYEEGIVALSNAAPQAT